MLDFHMNTSYETNSNVIYDGSLIFFVLLSKFHLIISKFHMYKFIQNDVLGHKNQTLHINLTMKAIIESI